MHGAYRFTKIVCTVGPATSNERAIELMVREGMNVARLNFSHGSHDEHLERIRMIRNVSEKLGVHVGIIQDLPGPKLRVGRLIKEPVFLKRGERVILKAGSDQARGSEIPVTFSAFSELVSEGSVIYLADGTIKLRVLRSSGVDVECEVEVEGVLSSGKGINVPDVKRDIDAMTPEDREHLKFGLENGVDYVALSFVRRPEDVLKAKRAIRELGADVPVIAKVEKKEAVDNSERLVESADGIMVARGDLGVEVGLESVPLIQKKLISMCNAAGKPVITATQILISMVSQPVPTRAEVSDIANALLDGTDALMLSEETAVGSHYVEAVKVLSRVSERVEREMKYEPKSVHSAESLEEAVGRAACQVANALGVKYIAAYTRSGSTARQVAKHRPMIPILGLTPRADVARRLSLVWGVTPFVTREELNATDPSAVKENLYSLGLTKAGDTVVVVAGYPTGPVGSTNMVRVQKLD